MTALDPTVAGDRRAPGPQSEPPPGPRPDPPPGPGAAAGRAADDAEAPDGAEAPGLVEAASLGRSGRTGRRQARPVRRPALPRGARRLLAPLLLVALWQGLSAAGALSERTLAPPSAVVSVGWELASTGELSDHLLVSLQRVATGLAFGVGAGVALAVVAGLLRLGEDLVDPTMQVLRGVPVLGMMPLIILWFGIGETTKVLLVAIGTAFPVYVNTYAGIRSVDAGLVEAATVCGVGRAGLIRRVILPGALPSFLVGLRFALTGAWLIMIIAEQINARSGIGYLMNDARMWYQTDVIVFGLVVYGALGLGTDGLVRLAERTLLGWRRGFTGT
jgi:sulfonate transport system permease protein